MPQDLRLYCGLASGDVIWLCKLARYRRCAKAPLCGEITPIQTHDQAGRCGNDVVQLTRGRVASG
jgi:hypothetical protein